MNCVRVKTHKPNHQSQHMETMHEETRDNVELSSHCRRKSEEGWKTLLPEKPVHNLHKATIHLYVCKVVD